MNNSTLKRELVEYADNAAEYEFTSYFTELLRLAADRIPEDELQKIGTAWVNSNNAVWEFNPIKVCEESLGLKPVPVYIAAIPETKKE